MVAQIFVSAMAHFFVVVSGSKFHERMAHFFIDIYNITFGIIIAVSIDKPFTMDNNCKAAGLRINGDQLPLLILSRYRITF